MAGENKKRPQTVIPTMSRVLPSGEIVELVYDAKSGRTRLAVGIDGEFSVEDAVGIDANAKLVPVSPENDLIKHGVLLLPSAPETFDSVAKLVADIEAYLYRYVDLSERFRRIAAYYVLLTWVYDAFNELPYLRLRGDFGSGKSRALLVIGSLCYKAFFASGASTVSPIFHTLDAFRGTLIFDEADVRFSDGRAQIVTILNNGTCRS